MKNMIFQYISNNHEKIEKFLYTLDKYTLNHWWSCLSTALVLDDKMLKRKKSLYTDKSNI